MKSEGKINTFSFGSTAQDSYTYCLLDRSKSAQKLFFLTIRSHSLGKIRFTIH